MKTRVTIIEITAKAVALTTMGEGITRSNKPTFFLPRRVDLIPAKRIARVVVFMPPPVEPGLAPTNIKKTIPKIVNGEKLVSGTVLKPAVLIVID